jgi:hypothetical protein
MLLVMRAGVVANMTVVVWRGLRVGMVFMI